jgi:hypothetical protein
MIYINAILVMTIAYLVTDFFMKYRKIMQEKNTKTGIKRDRAIAVRR